MSYVLDSKIPSSTIFLDSTKAVSRHPFVFNLNSPIPCPTSLRMILSLQEFSVPNTFNNITTENNTISFRVGDFIAYRTITIPPGLYNVYTFRDYLNSTQAFNDFNMTCVYDKVNYRYSFLSILQIRLVNLPAINRPTTCGNIIGMEKNNNNQFVDVVLPTGYGDYTILMASSVNFSGTPFLYFKVDNLPLTNINSLGVINDTLCRVPVNSPFGYKIFYRPAEPIKYLIGRQVLNSITIKVEDTSNNTVLTGATEFEAVLRIDYVYPLQDKEDILTGTLTYDMSKLKLPDEEQDNEVDDI